MILKQYASCKIVLAEISRLEDLFRKQHKRAPKSQLIYSQGGDLERPIHSLGVWEETGYSEELTYFKNNLK
jgi:hypothetical protein